MIGNNRGLDNGSNVIRNNPPTSSTGLSRRSLLQRTGLLLVGGSGLLLAGCSASAEQSGSTVKMVDMTFEPANLTIKPGDTVTWINESTFVHTVTTDPKQVKDPSHVASPDGAALFNSENIGLDGRWSYTFTTEGSYSYCCSPHELAGMMGTVVVEPA